MFWDIGFSAPSNRDNKHHVFSALYIYVANINILGVTWPRIYSKLFQGNNNSDYLREKKA
jgi:hypothetical protein